MAKSVEFKLNLKGLNELMKSQEMVNCLNEVGASVSKNAGEEYGARTHEASFVAICNVYPDSEEAASENYEHNTLLKALGASGLPTKK